MAEDWLADVRKYVADADENVVKAIIRYCGIALQNRGFGFSLRAAHVGTTPTTANTAAGLGTPVPLGGPPRRPYPNLLD